jgi:subtilase family serine protease
MPEQRTFSGTMAAAVLAAIAAVSPLGAQTNRITGPIDNSRTVTLPGHVNPNARAEFDQGAVDDSFPLNSMAFALKPSAAQQADLDALLAAQQDRASPDFRNWLTPEQFGDRFGASQSDVAQITGWLEAQGFAIHRVARSRNWIAFGGSAGLARQAFGVEIHRYQVNGEPHIANTGEPSLPAAFAGLVAAIRGLDDFRARPAYTSASGQHYLVPDDAQTIYNLKSLYNAGYDGTGQKLVVVGESDLEVTAVQDFRVLFGLPANNPQVVLVPGSSDPGVVGGWLVEADLDVEWAGAMARNATLIYVYSDGDMESVQYAVSEDLAPVISSSYVLCELASQNALVSMRGIAQQANAEGITWIASSGDTGPFGCDIQGSAEAVKSPAVNLPASMPEVTGVGGTSFNEGSGTYWSVTNNAAYGSALSYIPETSWNDTSAVGGLWASGGGPSALFSKPSWQAGTDVPSDGFRDVPDVAMPAGLYHDGAKACIDYFCANGVPAGDSGGTSLAAPMFAGIAVLINQYQVATGAAAKPGLGNMNPTLYALAAKYGDAFHDIVSGNNIEPCGVNSAWCTTGSFGYQAGVGYDLVTGLGSVDAYNLAVEWNLVATASSAPVVTYSWTSMPRPSQPFSGTITGTGFTSGMLIWFCSVGATPGCGELAASQVTVTSSTSATVTNVTLAAGWWQVSVQTAAGQSALSAAFGVTGPAPTVTAYTWSTPPRPNQPFSGTITGTGFDPGMLVWFCQSEGTACVVASQVTVTGSTSATVANVALAAGRWQVYVQTAAGQSALSAAFLVGARPVRSGRPGRFQ